MKHDRIWFETYTISNLQANRNYSETTKWLTRHTDIRKLSRSAFCFLLLMIANRSFTVNGWQNFEALIPYVMM